MLDLFSESPHLQKPAIIFLVGYFGIRNNFYYESKLCSNNNDEIGAHFENMSNAIVNNICDNVVSVVGKVKIQKLDSFYSIYSTILDVEALELYKLVKFVESKNRIPICVKTDAVIYSGEEININNYYWDDNKNIKKFKHEEPSLVKKVVNIHYTDKLQLTDNEYNVIHDNNNFCELIDKIIDSEKGCLILGSAGTGKTTLLNQLTERLNDKKILKLCPTNKSAILIGGETLDKFSYNFIHQTKNWRNIKTLIISLWMRYQWY